MTDQACEQSSPRLRQRERHTEDPHRAAASRARIAELTHREIAQMQRDEAIDIIEFVWSAAAPVPLGNELRRFDRDRLEELVYAARRTCRRQGY